MSTRVNVTFGGVPSGAIITTTSETVVGTLGLLILPFDNTAVLLVWNVLLTIGAGTTGLQLRIRRGTTTAGAQLNLTNALTVTAGNLSSFTGVSVDTNPGPAGASQYALSVQQVAATGNATVQDGSILGLAL